ncbi:MAG: PAS domain S-box protein, partial [Deltaproteobacteria bacterium]|nr:PAS domain S-box protein [Candidatus Zymogenaceae bacterium]
MKKKQIDHAKEIESLTKKISELEAVIQELTRPYDTLENGQSKLKDILKNIQEGYYETDLSGNMTYVNIPLTDMIGYRSDEILNENFRRFSPKKHHKGVVTAFNSVYRTGKPIKTLTGTFLKKNGDIRNFELSISPRKNRTGETIGFSGIVRDVSERLKAQKEISYLRELNDSIINSILDPLDIIDKNFKIVFQNDASVEQFGTGVGKRCYRFFSKRSSPCPNCETIHTITKKIPIKRETEYRGLVWEILSFPILMPDGETYGALEIFRDVTERKRATEAIKRSEERWKNLFDNSIDPFFTVDLKGNITAANTAMDQLTGYTKTELVRMRYTDLMDPDTAQRVKLHFNRLHRTGLPIQSKIYSIKNKFGDELIIEGNVNVIREGDEIVGFQGSFKDITVRKLMENALRESEERIRNIFETSADVIFVTNISGEIVDINPAIEAISGYSVKEMIGAYSHTFYKNPNQREELIEELKQKGYIKNKEMLFLKKDGSELEGLITIAPRLDSEGEILGIQGTIKDITEKKRLEQQLVQAQKMEALGNLAGGIAHNFNNILVGIMGYSEFLMKKKDENDSDYKAVKTIFESTIRAAEMTRQLLNIARAGEHTARKIQPEAIVKNTLPLIKNIFDKSISITTHIQKNIMPVIGDQGQLEQCLLNLCINARDAMPDGGELIIEIENRHIEEDYARSHLEARTGEYVVLTVSDTGCGMTPEVKQRIFEPFFTTKGDQGGTGMGLATLYGIIKNHEGFINVYSEEHVGTTFRLYLPISTEQVVEAPEEIVPVTVRGTETILLIDDEPYVLEMWGDLLEENGYVVLTAEDGFRGVEIYRERAGDIDLVVLDYIMPGMGGDIVIEQLKGIDADVKILVASGYSENGQAKGI